MHPIDSKHISSIKTCGKYLDVFRDKQGKYYVRYAGKEVQKRLTANEIVMYLCNRLHTRG